MKDAYRIEERKQRISDLRQSISDDDAVELLIEIIPDPADHDAERQYCENKVAEQEEFLHAEAFAPSINQQSDSYPQYPSDKRHPASSHLKHL